MLGRTTTLVVVLQVIASLKIFDQIYLITAGGPNYATRSAIECIYDTGVHQPAGRLRLGGLVRPVHRHPDRLVRLAGPGPPAGEGSLTMAITAPRPRTAGRTRNPAGRSAQRPPRKDWRASLFRRAVTGVVIALALLWLVPVAWALDTSVKRENDDDHHPGDLGRARTSRSRPTAAVFRASDLGRWYLNSAIVAIVVTVLTVITASMAGYALSRRQFRGKAFIYAAILAGIMIPPQALIVPLFREFQTVHLINTYWALILPQVPAPIAVFIFKKFFDGVPISWSRRPRSTGPAGGSATADRAAAGPPGHRRRLDLHLRLDLEQLPVAVPGRHQPDHDDDPGRDRHRDQRGRHRQRPADGLGRARRAAAGLRVPAGPAPDRRRRGRHRPEVGLPGPASDETGPERRAGVRPGVAASGRTPAWLSVTTSGPGVRTSRLDYSFQTGTVAV